MTACLQITGMPFLCMVCRNGIVCGMVAGYHKQMVCDMRPGAAEADHAANLRCRDANTYIVREKDKEKIRIELRTDEERLTDKDGDKMKDLLGCVKEVTRNVGAKALFGFYRGFAMHIVRYTQPFGGKDVFRMSSAAPESGSSGPTT